MRRGDGGDGIVIRGEAEKVDRNDHPRLEPKPRCGRHRAVTACRIEIERFRLDIGHHRRRAAQRHHLRRRAEGEGGADHGVTRSDPPCHEHEAQRIRPVRAADRVPRPAECRQLGLERTHFRTLDELAMRKDARDGVVDGAAEAAPLGGDVDERDRLVLKARVLIHDLVLFDPRAKRGPAQPATRRGPLRCGTVDDTAGASRQRMATSRLATPSSPVTAGGRPLRIALTKASNSERSGSA